MNITVKYIVFVLALITASIIFLKPILSHDDEYRVVVVNISERPISNVIISGGGANANTTGTIEVGNMQDFYFIVTHNDQLRYSFSQDNESFDGVIKESLTKAEVGEIYVVIGEMHKVKIVDDYSTAY